MTDHQIAPDRLSGSQQFRGTGLPGRLLRGRTRDFDIGSLFERSVVSDELEAGERRLLCFLLPPWQRPEVWTELQKRRFIEGIFLGLGTGYYVVNQSDWNEGGALPMSGWLIDGQQRLSAIRDFGAGKLTIFDGLTYGGLTGAEQAGRFKRIVFPCLEIDYQADESLLRGLYDRLNFGGTAHLESERAEQRERCERSMRPTAG